MNRVRFWNDGEDKGISDLAGAGIDGKVLSLIGDSSGILEQHASVPAAEHAFCVVAASASLMVQSLKHSVLTGDRHLVALVSVIIPAYNAALYIRQTLESVCAQTYRLIEVIVVDDGSCDGTCAIVEDVAARDSRVCLVRQENAGVGAARNTGIRQAKGVYVAPIDADDIWHPCKLQEQVACMETNGPRTGLVYCWVNIIDENGVFVSHGSPTELQGYVLIPLIKRNFIACASAPLFRAEALGLVGDYLTRKAQNGAQGCEDWDLSIRIAEHYEVRFVRAHLVGYRDIEGLTLRTTEMIHSFKFVQRRARERNADLNPRLFRGAESPFYYWLGFRCYMHRRFARCIILVLRSIRSDMKTIFTRPVYSLLIKSAIALLGWPPLAQRTCARDVVSPGTIASMFPPTAVTRCKMLRRSCS